MATRLYRKTKRTRVTLADVTKIGKVWSVGHSGQKTGKIVRAQYGIHPASARRIVYQYFEPLTDRTQWEKGVTEWQANAQMQKERKARQLAQMLATETPQKRRARTQSGLAHMHAIDRTQWLEIARGRKKLTRARWSEIARDRMAAVAPEIRSARVRKGWRRIPLERKQAFVQKRNAAIRAAWKRLPAEVQERRKQRLRELANSIPQEVRSQAGKKAAETRRKRILQRLGVLYVEKLPILDRIKEKERNELITAKLKSIESTIKEFRGEQRYEQDQRTGIIENLRGIAIEAAITAIRKCANRGKLDELIHDQIVYDLYHYLAREKNRRLTERFHLHKQR